MAVPLHAVDPKRSYVVSFEDTPEKSRVPGAALSALPIGIQSAPGSAIIYYRARK